jgi:FKBP-type peptidyl-prolyl cis-trans isomerase
LILRLADQEIHFMRERWIQFSAALLCGLGACAANGPSTTRVAATQPATTHPVMPERHEPVAPPPPPSAASVPVVQPVTTRAAAPHPPAPAVPMATTQPGPIDDRVAYGIAYAAGRRIHDRLQEDGRTADELQMMKGFIDGLSDHDPAYPRQDVQAAFAEFQAYTLQQQAEKMYANNPAFRKVADENLQKSRAILDQNAEMAGVEVRPDGVQMQVLTPGSGRIVGNAKTISVKNLRVSLVDGTLIKSTEGDQIEKIAASDALSGWMDAIRGMKIGTKARVWLPPDKAYGLTGKPAVVGPNQAIEYEFELVNAE